MPMPMPPQGAPQGAPQDQAPAQPQAQQDPAALASQAHDGIMGLLDLAKGAKLDPQTLKLGTDAYSAFQAFVDHLGKPPGQGSPGPQAPGGPIQDGAAPDSIPANF